MPKRIMTPTSNVLVTGVTGLIGGEIVRRLASEHRGSVWALIRPNGNQTVRSRFLQRMKRSQPDVREQDLSRVQIAQGDITAPMLGLDAATNRRVSESIDIVIHCAADTSFIHDRNVRDTNIQGTARLIEFAKSCRRPPLIVYMSTATNGGKLVDRCLAESEGCRPDNEHHNAYTQSKAVAETMLRESGLPLLIVRPTIVLSEHLPDAAFARAILWFVPLLNEFDALPLRAKSRLDLVPVSFVVESTLRLIQKLDRRFDCYHLSAGDEDAVSIRELADFIDRFYRRRTPLRLVDPDDWNSDAYRRFVKTRMQRRIFFGLRYYLPFLNMNVIYDNRRLCDELGSEMPPIASFQEYMGDMLDQITLEGAVMELATP